MQLDYLKLNIKKLMANNEKPEFYFKIPVFH